MLVGVIGNRLRCFLTERSTRLGLSTHPAIWSAYYERGKLQLAKVQLQEAFIDFGNALDCVRRWRAEVLPADAFRISSEVELQQVYSSYIEVGSRLYELTRETLVVAEESPAASLRKLPNEYWEALADLYKAEALYSRVSQMGTRP